MHGANSTSGQVRSACTPRWQPCVRAQATLYKKKHYHCLPAMTATNSDSKRCQVSVDVSFQSPSCFQRKKARTFSSQVNGGRPHRLSLGGVQSKQRRNHLCGGNVLISPQVDIVEEIVFLRARLIFFFLLAPFSRVSL